jgi:mono/diheme cytochrome c family protein
MKRKNFDKGVMTFSNFLTFTFINLLVSCGGNTNNSTQSGQTQSTTSVATENSPYVAGKTIYQKTCLVCHQADGKGVSGTYPPLAGSDYLLADKFRAIRQVLKGSMSKIIVNGTDYQGVMTPQALNDSDVAQVLNYVYHSFGNNGFAVTSSEVKAVRDTIK